jgi:hypothetical protein
MTVAGDPQGADCQAREGGSFLHDAEHYVPVMIVLSALMLPVMTFAFTWACGRWCLICR